MDKKSTTKISIILFSIAFELVSCGSKKQNEFYWSGNAISSISKYDSKRVLIAGVNRGLLLWNFNTGESQEIKTEFGDIFVAVSANKFIALVDGEKNITILSPEDFSILDRRKIHSFSNDIKSSDNYLSLDQTVNGPLLFRYKDDRKLEIVNLEGAENIDSSKNVAIQFQKKLIIAGVKYQSGLFTPEFGLAAWNTDGKILWQKSGEKALLNGMDFSEDGNLLASVDKSGWLKLRYSVDGKVIIEKKHDRGFTSVAFLKDGKHIITGDFSGKLNVWNLESLEKVKTIQAQNEGYMPILVIDDSHVITGGADGQLRVIDLNTLISE